MGAPAGYVGSGKDFLDSYFRTGLQTSGPGTAAQSGSSSNAANAQILQKSSAYWVATTHVQYNLDMADINIAANRTAEAKANMDSAAAAYFGCGDTNPVPLPKYKGTQITYSTTAGSPDTGSNATTMSIYGVANKRAANYLTAKAVPGGTSSATSPGTTKTVAELNIEVGTAFNAATPTAATVQAIRDATNTIFAQAAQRYIAKITLAAHMPGNGMGGSTRPTQDITTPAKNPTTGYWGSSWGIWAQTETSKKQATACGGLSSQTPQVAVTPGGTGGAPTYATPSLLMNGGLACSKMTSAAGSAVSNTATFSTVQPVVSQIGSGLAAAAKATPTPSGEALATACPTVSGQQAVAPCLATAATIKLPYAVGMTETQLATNVAKNGGLTNNQIRKATRGIAQTGDVPAITVTPTACIGPDVIFNDVANSGAANGVPGTATLAPRQGVALCDPNGFAPANTVAQVGASVGGTKVDGIVPAATRTYAQNKLWYSGTIGGAAAAQTNGVKLNVQKFWDPITAAQASGGAFCCAALYYGSDGLGRGGATGIAGVTKNKDFKPNALVGDAMETQNVAGGMCSDGSSSTSVKQGLSAALNVKEKEFLEGQAFFASVAPSMYVLPKVNSLQATQTANAAKQKKCAQTLTTMLKMNQIAKGTSTDATVCKADGRVTAGTTGTSNAACYGAGYSAVPYPLWKVKIGDASPAEYVVPNGYCYANACIEDFAAVGTATAFKGPPKLSTLQASPDMSSNPSTTTNACGRANAACAAPPSTWNGGAAIFTKCSKTTDVLGAPTRDCTDAELKGQIGMLPSA